MNQWNKVIANSNLIQAETAKAVLIKLPKSELKFWHPAKCVRTSGKGGYRLEISFTDNWKFNLFRNGKGKYNFKDKIDEREIDAKEFTEFFSNDQD